MTAQTKGLETMKVTLSARQVSILRDWKKADRRADECLYRDGEPEDRFAPTLRDLLIARDTLANLFLLHVKDLIKD